MLQLLCWQLSLLCIITSCIVNKKFTCALRIAKTLTQFFMSITIDILLYECTYYNYGKYLVESWKRMVKSCTLTGKLPSAMTICNNTLELYAEALSLLSDIIDISVLQIYSTCF